MIALASCKSRFSSNAWFVQLLPPALPRPTNITLSVLPRHSLKWLKHKNQGESMLARNVNSTSMLHKVWTNWENAHLSWCLWLHWNPWVIPIHLFSQTLCTCNWRSWKSFDAFRIFLMPILACWTPDRLDFIPVPTPRSAVELCPLPMLHGTSAALVHLEPVSFSALQIPKLSLRLPDFRDHKRNPCVTHNIKYHQISVIEHETNPWRGRIRLALESHEGLRQWHYFVHWRLSWHGAICSEHFYGILIYFHYVFLWYFMSWNALRISRPYKMLILQSEPCVKNTKWHEQAAPPVTLCNAPEKANGPIAAYLLRPKSFQTPSEFRRKGPCQPSAPWAPRAPAM